MLEKPHDMPEWEWEVFLTNVLRRRRRRHLQGASGYSPVVALGSNLIAYLDANRSDLITQSGSVSAWRDIVAGYTFSQGTGAARPLYSATGFNGSPAVLFDGIDDNMSSLDAALLANFPPTAAELWVLAGNTALPADAATRSAAAFGGGTTAFQLCVRRTVITSVNRGQGSAGNGSTSVTSIEGTIDLSSRHVMRSIATNSAISIEIDGVVSTPAAVTTNIGAARAVVGALAGGTSNFWQGPVAAVLITKPLPTDQADSLRTYLMNRRML